MTEGTTQRLHEENASRMSHLESRVTGIESTLVSVVDSLKGIGTKLDARSQPQWSVLISAIGLSTTILIAIGTLAFSPLDKNQNRLEAELRTTRDSIVPREEHTGRWRMLERDFDTLRERLKRTEDRNEKRLDRLEERSSR